jgi:transcriptional regulator with XRE-family HTH domain
MNNNAGNRLREERLRLGLSQAAMSALSGIVTNSQIRYESMKRTPDINYMEAIDLLGADIHYIITGARGGRTLSPKERELMKNYRFSSRTDKRLIERIASFAAADAVSKLEAPPNCTRKVTLA